MQRFYTLHPVPHDLAPWVESVWTLDSPEAVEWEEHVWPSLRPNVIFAGSGYQRGWGAEIETIAFSTLDGVGIGPTQYQHHGNDRLTGLQFRPGGLAALVSDVSSLRDASVPLNDVATPPGRSVWTLRGPQVRVDAALSWVRQAIAFAPVPVDRLLDALGRHSRVADAAETLGCTTRTLRRRTLKLIGVSPKEIQRLIRFRRTAERLDREFSTSGFAPLYDGGFADQAHFCRECRALTGASPTTWWGTSDSFNRG